LIILARGRGEEWAMLRECVVCADIREELIEAIDRRLDAEKKHGRTAEETRRKINVQANIRLRLEEHRASCDFLHDFSWRLRVTQAPKIFDRPVI
jgi:hypothetical protein